MGQKVKPSVNTKCPKKDGSAASRTTKANTLPRPSKSGSSTDPPGHRSRLVHKNLKKLARLNKYRKRTAKRFWKVSKKDRRGFLRFFRVNRSLLAAGIACSSKQAEHIMMRAREQWFSLKPFEKGNWRRDTIADLSAAKRQLKKKRKRLRRCPLPPTKFKKPIEPAKSDILRLGKRVHDEQTQYETAESEEETSDAEISPIEPTRRWFKRMDERHKELYREVQQYLLPLVESSALEKMKKQRSEVAARRFLGVESSSGSRPRADELNIELRSVSRPGAEIEQHTSTKKHCRRGAV